MVRWRIQVSGLLLLAPALTVRADTPPAGVAALMMVIFSLSW